jgi:Flp pilus assembly pilin Flp
VESEGLVIGTTLGVFAGRMMQNEKGTALTEFAMLLFFIAVVAILAVTALGETVQAMFERAVEVFVHQ